MGQDPASLSSRPVDVAAATVVAAAPLPPIPPIEEPPPRPQLGKILVAKKLASERQVNYGLQEQRRTGERLGQILVRQGVLTERELQEALATHLGVRHVDLLRTPVDSNVARRLREQFCRRERILAVQQTEGGILLAMADPLDVIAIDDAQSVLQSRVVPMMADRAQLEQAIERVWPTRSELDAATKMAARQAARERQHRAAPEQRPQAKTSRLETAADSPIVRLVDELFERAARQEASDVHIEVTSAGYGDPEVRIRFRVDGMLQDIMRTPILLHESLIRRVKILCDMDIAERRRPQDGGARLTIAGRPFELRAVTVPTSEGESAVVRLVDSSRAHLGLNELGFEPEVLARYRSCFVRPAGLTVLSGPTGAGKSTTLRATVAALNEPGRSIVTIEDPVEVNIPGVRQVAVSPRAGLTFLDAFDALLRADPDVVIVGEIRDPDVARAVAQAAVTGHAVFTTLHTQSASLVPGRLVEMGVEPYLVTASLQAAVNQRLLRRACPSCRKLVPPPTDELERARWAPAKGTSLTFVRAVGCNDCFGTGYRGRIAIHELLVMSDALRDAIRDRAPTGEVAAVAMADGMVPLVHDGLRRAAAGETTVDEVLRVIG